MDISLKYNFMKNLEGILFHLILQSGTIATTLQVMLGQRVLQRISICSLTSPRLMTQRKC